VSQKLFNSSIIRCCLLVLAVALLCWFSYLHGRGDGVRADGITVSEVKQQLKRAGENQRAITDSVAGIEERVKDSQQQAADAAESTERAGQYMSELENQNNRAGELIAECQSILGGARKRVQPKNQED